MDRLNNAFVNKWAFPPEKASTYVNPSSKWLMVMTESGAEALRPATASELAEVPEIENESQPTQWMLVIMGAIGILAATACAALAV